MKRTVKYENLDELNGVGGVVPDFLPSPAELAGGEKTVKITLALSERSVTFFKAAAERYHSSYQRMIRRLLDAYADRRSTPPAALRESKPPSYRASRKKTV